LQLATRALQVAPCAHAIIDATRARNLLGVTPLSLVDFKTLGSAASVKWLDDRGLDARRTPHWYVEVSIDSDQRDTRLELNIYPEEWGFVLRRGTKMSSIRITDVPFVHGLDDFQLLATTPALAEFGGLITVIERRFELGFFTTRATVRSNLTRAAAVVRPWLELR
jgi:hypothetical protein